MRVSETCETKIPRPSGLSHLCLPNPLPSPHLGAGDEYPRRRKGRQKQRRKEGPNQNDANHHGRGLRRGPHHLSCIVARSRRGKTLFPKKQGAGWPVLPTVFRWCVLGTLCGLYSNLQPERKLWYPFRAAAADARGEVPRMHATGISERGVVRLPALPCLAPIFLSITKANEGGNPKTPRSPDHRRTKAYLGDGGGKKTWLVPAEWILRVLHEHVLPRAFFVVMGGR
jgi:hypothetical protein